MNTNIVNNIYMNSCVPYMTLRTQIVLFDFCTAYVNSARVYKGAKVFVKQRASKLLRGTAVCLLLRTLFCKEEKDHKKLIQFSAYFLGYVHKLTLCYNSVDFLCGYSLNYMLT